MTESKKLIEERTKPCADCAQLRVELYSLLELLANRLSNYEGDPDNDFYMISSCDALGRKIFKAQP